MPKISELATLASPSLADNIPAEAGGNTVRLTIAQIRDLSLGQTLLALDDLSPAANRVPYFTDNDTAELTELSSYGRNLIGANNSSEGRLLLQLPALTDNDNLSVSQNNLPTRGNVLANIGVQKGTSTALKLVAYADVDNGGGGTFNVAFSEGFSSITRIGTGRYNLFFSTARANAQYMVIGNAGNNFDANFTYDDRSTTSFGVNLQNITGGAQDSRFSLMVMEPA